ncbi:extracellular solute-binding protein [Cohnella rhizosphaerae]|uniref:Extracellular solute-binding protein n=1 Tax=Cohnella rhizosphaerae TaxID=1457232 RepID=A0A9X4QU96_9BACL|nr:extracellular solute-binding protein [Cohnella rhizosphaerae]MDG0811244.1 extracellular solute-binding protein [Cohnella rhizosphaerae]
MKIRNAIPAALSAALAATLVLSACSNGNNKENAGSASPSGSAAPSAAAAAEKPIELKWVGWYPPESDDTYAQKFLENKFNVKFNNIKLDYTTAVQQLNVKLSSGEIPDVIPGYSDINGYAEMVKQGIAAELPIEEIRQYMPRYAKYIDELDPKLWSIGMIDGKNYGIPRTYGEGDAYFLPSYNTDWLNKIGYSEPPKTLAELEDVLTKFRNDDPDGNGKKDTYGFSARGKDTLGSNQIFNSVFGAYGVNPNAWMLVDGKLQFGITLEGARQALKTLNAWYKAELLDPEFITDDFDQYRGKFINGKVGMLDQALWYHLDPSGNIGGDAAKAGMKFTVGQPVTGPSGKRAAGAQGYSVVPIIMSAEAHKDEKKRIKIYELLDSLAFDPETYLAAVYGEKGVHYDEVDGAAVPKPEFTDQQKAGAVAGIGYFYGLFKANTMRELDRPKSQLEFRASVVKPDVTRLYNVLPNAILPSWIANADAITKMIKEYEIKFITGQVDTDKGFDDFVAKLNGLGLAKARDEAEQLYAERNKA